MSVILRKRLNSNGTTSLRLDITHGGKRWPETLKNLQLEKPSNLAIREANKSKLALAEKIAVERASQLESEDYGMIKELGRRTIVTDWLQSYVDNYRKKDKRNMQGVQKRFVEYLSQTNQKGLVFGKLTESIVEDFHSYLCERSQGEGARSYFARFKKMIRQAHKENMMSKNPAIDVKNNKGHAKKKDVMTMEEIQQLSSTPIQSEEVKRAFLFSCVTGLRWVDVNALKWSNINLKEQTMEFRQSKTGQDLATTLNATALKLLGEPKKPSDKIFLLPSANGANKTVKAWVKRAGIEKAITWHNARHSFGTNLIFNDVGILTASQLLGHRSLKDTQRYVDTAKAMKQAATDKLNIDL